MIHTKKDLINKIKKLSSQIIEQGIQLRTLALSIESKQHEYSLKELKEKIQPFLEKLETERGYK